MPRLEWIGKSAVATHHRSVPYRPLERVAELSCPALEDHDDGNLIVQGDNLEALKALLPRYAGRVKCIYIDPPYNTGNEGWAYNDNVDSPEIRRWLHEVVGREGETLDRHDRWLCMMYPRLLLLRQFLAHDGVIFISIDDHELANLLLLACEIFGRRNYVEVFSWIKTETPSNLSQKTKKKTEYVVCFQAGGFDGRFRGLQRSSNSDNPLLKKQNSLKTLVFPPGSVITNLRGEGSITRGGHGTKTNQVFLETDARYADGRFLDAVTLTGRFIWTQPNLEEELAAGTEIRIKTGTMIPSYEKTSYEPEVPSNLIGADEEVWSNEVASRSLASIGVDFDYPKPESLVRYLINMVCDRDSIVLDSFAGSGTTAHAVLAQNQLDGGRRRFLLVEMDDRIAREVTARRVSRVARGYRSGETDVAGLGGGFSYCRLSPEPMFGADGRVHDGVRFGQLAELAWHAESGAGPDRPGEATTPLLGVVGGKAVFLLHDDGGPACRESGNALDGRSLKVLRRHAGGFAGPWVVYGARTRFDPDRLAALGIDFKPLPYSLRDLAWS